MTNELQNLTNLVNNPLNAMESNISNEFYGPLRVKTGSQWAIDASRRPDPVSMWKELWNQGEVCCLFANSGSGKSIYAVQIGQAIARKEKVIYFDFELTDKQFQLRYTNPTTKQVHHFPDNFYRSEVDLQYYQGDNFEYDIIKSIEEMAIALGATTIIVDNLTWLCNDNEKGGSASRLMQNLVALKKEHGWSILVIAHTPKITEIRPLTDNDLAGSKRLFNFFDSVFAIGKSHINPGHRYIKQLKARATEIIYDESNVILCEITRDDDFTQFHEIGYTTERDQLKSPYAADEGESKADAAKRLKAEGYSINDIAEHLSLSTKSIYRLLK